MRIDFMDAPASIAQFSESEQITNLLYLIWLSRPDLQAVFNVSDPEGQAAFKGWVRDSVKREYRIEPVFYGQSSDLPGKRPRSPFEGRQRLLSTVLHKVRACQRRRWPEPGATLLGYTDGVLGMGEHVRMSAETLARASVPFGVFDIDPGPHHKRAGYGGRFPMVNSNRFKTNIFHVNADQMLNTFCLLGSDFFRERYNIGFWAWELEKCPSCWLPVIGMVDEIWAPSRFIQHCFAEVTDKPVTWMPLCVELPKFEKRSPGYFGLPANECLFLYTFDFHSYLDRKNPFAAIRAFKQAFPLGNEKARLILKCMKGDPLSAKWRAMIDAIADDPRVHVINEVMSRSDILALMDVCHCFVSLHRSEGFGRGPAEAMYLGKPVIATAYSGNLDFTRPGASLLVDYKLIPVEEGQYVFADDQVWADIDDAQAAQYMRMVFEHSSEVKELARKGQQIIRDEFSYSAIGRRMKDRLLQLNLIGS